MKQKLRDRLDRIEKALKDLTKEMRVLFFDLVKRRHDAYNSVSPELQPRWLYQRIRKKEPFKEVKIASKEWSDHTRRDAVEKAVLSVEKLIAALGSKSWPALSK